MVTTTDVGMMTELIPQVFLLELMLELKVAYGNVNNGHGNANNNQRGISCPFQWYWNVGSGFVARILFGAPRPNDKKILCLV